MRILSKNKLPSCFFYIFITLLPNLKYNIIREYSINKNLLYMGASQKLGNKVIFLEMSEMKTNNLTSISEKDYLEKVNDTVIDGATEVDIRKTINKFLRSKRRPTSVGVNFTEAHRVASRKYNTYNYIQDIYDHMHSFRIRLPASNTILKPKTISVTFSFPYNAPGKITEYLNEPWLDKRFMIYFTNPRLYRYYKNNTVGLANVYNLDKKYGEGATDALVANINKEMIQETSEPLFYLIN